jgi:CBS-domain-containing membrane protein
MIKDVKACRMWDSLNVAAQLMWDHGCGSVPVLDANSKVAGMLTDRDICMAAYTQGKALREILVSSAMSKVVHFAKPEDNLVVAEGIMKAGKVRRLPILDADGRLAGIISLDDIAKVAVRQREAMTREVHEAEVGRTLAGICEKETVKAVNKPRPAASAPATAR